MWHCKSLQMHLPIVTVSCPNCWTGTYQAWLSGDDADFLQTVKMFRSNTGSEKIMIQGWHVSASLKAAANIICTIVRWIRKEDYLESYLCMPGWGGINHFAPESSFLGRISSMSRLQGFHHFRSETLELVTVRPSCYKKK